MSDKIRVLVFPCGSENAAEIHQALRYSVHVELHGASSVDDHGRFRFARYAGDLPKISDPCFDEAFARLLAERRIDLVFATHDTVHEYLSARAAQMSMTLVNGDPESAAIARRKSSTYYLFANEPWVPRTYASAGDVHAWPVIVKPDLGQGGQGVTLAHDMLQLNHALAAVEAPLIVEYLPGEELTIDCFTDRKRRLLHAQPRSRERVKAGIAMRSHLIDSTPEIDAIAHSINNRMRLRGPWFFQLKADRDGRWKLLEVACRVGGTMVAQRARGVNLPLMAVQDFLGRDLVTLPNAQIRLIDRNIATRASFACEYDAVCIDLDDTLIIDGYAVPQTIAFLYQSIAAGKRIVLLTRHRFDVAKTLEAARIDARLFDDIVVLGAHESKADHVPPRSIFIDNHFPERLDVARKCNVPVLDVDTVEFFLR
ncbi:MULTISPECIES: ATP-grasp domain-containing protein [Burkholderia]|uniref:Carbamoyl-phosphate synthase large subunit n=1 Tax=Burkholderia savannae TaxID=1637837 RepID=A0ABR5T9K7_9BURK|nr:MULTISPECIES: ATP-grasp domain-containing protein [Burkholderia]KGR96310.1 ATP-grasp domain protein [Burkholderia sp. ABCPW 111]KVK77103.1 carbamoyl-phosphate synthase large subunit [Burkholderia sp. MSMB1498]KWZ40073.1 carbamoyl-phosphate synthase large subunit [Burkholderia savannae]KWZ41595.1 carbamoyl-phosphate synthase large subunit [Burkholderia savannae]